MGLLPAVSSFLPFNRSFYSGLGSSSHGNRRCLTSYQALSRRLGPTSHLLSSWSPCCPEPEDPQLLLAMVLVLPGLYVSLFLRQDPQPLSAPCNCLASKTQDQFFPTNLPGDPWVAGSISQLHPPSVGNRNSGSFRGC